MKALFFQSWFEKWSLLARSGNSAPVPSNWQSIELFPQPSIGIVEMTISGDRPGRVKYQSTYWPARILHPSSDIQGKMTFKPNEKVMVMGREGITLLVAPLAS